MGWADSGFPKNRRDIKRAEKRQEIKSGLGSLPKAGHLHPVALTHLWRAQEGAQQWLPNHLYTIASKRP